MVDASGFDFGSPPELQEPPTPNSPFRAFPAAPLQAKGDPSLCERNELLMNRNVQQATASLNPVPETLALSLQPS